MDTKREEKIRDGFGWKKLGLGTKILFNSLKTDEELTVCALSCRAAEKEPFALQAIQRITDREALYRIAAEAPSSASRTAAIDRFKDDRAMLMRVWRITWAKEKWLLDAARKRAAEHLAVLERKQIDAAGDDSRRLADLLCSGEVEIAYEDAIERITDPAQLVRAAVNACFQQIADAAVARLSELTQTSVNVDPLLDLLESAPSKAIAQAAEKRIFALCGAKDGPALPLGEAQLDRILQYCCGCRDLSFNKLLGLLGDMRLRALYRQRKEDYDKTVVASCFSPEDCTDEILLQLFFAKGPDARARGRERIAALDTPHILRLYTDASDEQLVYFLYGLLDERAACSDAVNAKLDAVITPKIDAARTADGYNGVMLCQLDMTLPPSVQKRYGFEEVFTGGETIDGASWSAKKLRFDGRSYWFYYQQSDGGGSYHTIGERA